MYIYRFVDFLVSALLISEGLAKYKDVGGLQIILKHNNSPHPPPQTYTEHGFPFYDFIDFHCTMNIYINILHRNRGRKRIFYLTFFNASCIEGYPSHWRQFRSWGVPSPRQCLALSAVALQPSTGAHCHCDATNNSTQAPPPLILFPKVKAGLWNSVGFCSPIQS